MRQFRVFNRFEKDNVYGPIMFLDEYGLSDTHFDPQDVVVDIGAHIGTFTYFCHSRGSRATYSFEPSLRNFALLQLNCGSLPGVHLFHTAIWRSDRPEGKQLKLSGPAGENTGANSALAGGRCIDYSKQTFFETCVGEGLVSATPLDRVLEKFDQVKLLKIDCEGSEFPILLTSAQLSRVERIVGEVHEIEHEMMTALEGDSLVEGYPAYRLEDLTNRLNSLGFSVKTRSSGPHMYLFEAHRDI